jgi:hypothetical protein
MSPTTAGNGMACPPLAPLISTTTMTTTIRQPFGDCRVRLVGFPGIANYPEHYLVEEAVYHQGVNP